MGNSLSDQLLKAGLVNDAKAKKVRSEKHKNLKQQRKHKIETVNETKEQFQKQQQLKVEKDRKLNRQIKEQAEKNLRKGKRLYIRLSHGTDSGSDTFLKKPFTPDTLAHAVRKALEDRENADGSGSARSKPA